MTDEQWIKTQINCKSEELEQEESIKEIKKEQYNFTLILAFITGLILIGLLIIGIVKYKKSVSQTNIVIVGDTQGPK